MQDNTVSFTLKSDEKILYQPGDLVGDSYVLLDMLAKGGMGVVYRARHVQLDKIFALKLLAPMQMTDVNWKRFELEARTLAKLQHPNVVQIYNMGIDRKGCPYYVMELLDGISISDALAGVDEDDSGISGSPLDSNQYVGGPLPLNQFVQCFADVCKALSFAHDKNIVHRDIKPSNLMLINSALPVKLTKVVDFGIARLVGPEELSSQGLTLPGEVFGSPLYMSPEQTMGQPISKATDVYSLGCTMFEIFTGAPPFKGKSAFDTMLMHQNAAVPQIIRDDCDPEVLAMVEDIIVQCMAKQPAERFADAGDILEPLEAVASLVDSGSRSPRAKPSSDYKSQGKRFSSGPDSQSQSATQENTKGLTSTRGRILLVTGSLTAIISVVGMVALTVPRAAQDKHQDAQSDVRKNIAPESKPLAPVHTLSMAELPDFEAPADATWLRSNVPISRKYSIDQKPWRTFEFPEVPVGNLSQDGVAKIEAKGKITKDGNLTFHFLASEKLKDHCEIYSRFDPEALDFLELKNVSKPPEMTVLASWKNLIGLAFTECTFPSYWIEQLSQMQRVQDLLLIHTDLDPVALKKSGLMQRLYKIHFDRVDTHSAVLALTANSKRLRSATLKSIKLSAADSSIIASWPPMRELFIRDCTCTAPVLQRIKHGEAKIALDIRGSKFVPGDLESIASLTNLFNLRFVDGSLSPVLIRRIKARNPGLLIQKQEDDKNGFFSD